MATVGDVTDISLSSTTVRTHDHTIVLISNVMVVQLRVENLSAADRRRLELEVPIEWAQDACMSADLIGEVRE